MQSIQRLKVLYALGHSTHWAVALSVLVAECALSVPAVRCTPVKLPICADSGAFSIYARHGALTAQGLCLRGGINNEFTIPVWFYTGIRDGEGSGAPVSCTHSTRT